MDLKKHPNKGWLFSRRLSNRSWRVHKNNTEKVFCLGCFF